MSPFYIPYRRKYNGAVLMCGKSLRCRYIQIFCSKTAVLIKFFLKKWTFCQKSAVLFKFPPRCRNNQDCRSIYADTVYMVLVNLKNSFGNVPKNYRTGSCQILAVFQKIIYILPISSSAIYVSTTSM